MRMFVLAAVAAAVAIPSAASAQRWGGYGYHGGSEVRQELRECRRELRRADSRREYRREARECRREIREARRDDRRDWRDDRYSRYGYRDGYYRGDRRYWDGYRWRNRW